MASTYRYRVVDVFTEHPLQGNPLAVFPDARGLDSDTMQKIAQELNLSETSFVLPPELPGCAARVRIFTPTVEMVFAGHPTIGTSFVLLDEGLVPASGFNLQLKVGPVPIRIEAGARPLIWLRTPPITFGQTYDPALCAKAAGVDPADLLGPTPQLVTAGNPNIYIPLKTPEAVDRAWVDLAGLRLLETPKACAFIFAPTPHGAYSRMFAPEHGVIEDPATGSATGPLAAFMLRHSLAPGNRFFSEQGVKMGRRSILHVLIHDADTIDVGGHTTPLIDARMTL